MENENNELMIVNEGKTKVYCSKKAETNEEKKELFNALEKCDVLLNDCVGQEIMMKDLYIEERNVIDEFGRTKVKFRTIIFDENGQTYATGSYGIYNILKKIITIYGLPTEWDSPIKVQVAKRPIDNGKSTLTLILM